MLIIMHATNASNTNKDTNNEVAARADCLAEDVPVPPQAYDHAAALPGQPMLHYSRLDYIISYHIVSYDSISYHIIS